jgi:enoyl-CoA hydratase/carnithine racemase
MVVEYRQEGKTAVITLNRPEAYNAIDPESEKELSKALIDFRDDNTLWVGIITGAGNKAFCSGADVKKYFATIEQSGKKTWEEPSDHIRTLNIWKPLIAAINGIAFGGGLEICLACDIRISSENATFGLPEVNIGIIPGWGGTQRLPRLIPGAIAAEMLLTGRPISAQEAFRIGLINKVVPQGQLMATAMQMADLLARPSPLAARAAKQAMLEGMSMPLHEGLKLEKGLFDYTLGTEDFIEGRNAFFEKRKPNFKVK